jgi:hypothetical protein
MVENPQDQPYRRVPHPVFGVPMFSAAEVATPLCLSTRRHQMKKTSAKPPKSPDKLTKTRKPASGVAELGQASGGVLRSSKYDLGT